MLIIAAAKKKKYLQKLLSKGSAAKHTSPDAIAYGSKVTAHASKDSTTEEAGVKFATAITSMVRVTTHASKGSTAKNTCLDGATSRTYKFGATVDTIKVTKKSSVSVPSSLYGK